MASDHVRKLVNAYCVWHNARPHNSHATRNLAHDLICWVADGEGATKTGGDPVVFLHMVVFILQCPETKRRIRMSYSPDWWVVDFDSDMFERAVEIGSITEYRPTPEE